MTTTEILDEIKKLSVPERKEIKDLLDAEIINDNSPVDDENEPLNIRLQKKLFAAGLLREIKTSPRGRIGDFEAIKIEGEPVSEQIIRERR